MLLENSFGLTQLRVYETHHDGHVTNVTGSPHWHIRSCLSDRRESRVPPSMWQFETNDYIPEMEPGRPGHGSPGRRVTVLGWVGSGHGSVSSTHDPVFW